MKNILYIRRDNRATYVAEISKKYVCQKSIFRFIDEALGPCLSSFMGRKKSTQKLFGIRKATPIYFFDDIIFQPVNNLDAWNLTFINMANVVDFSKNGENTIILFKNNEKLEIEVPFARYKQFKKNCDIIVTNQLKK